MSYGVLGKIVWALALASAAVLVAMAVAFAHNEFRCGSVAYKNANGGDCCSANQDCYPIPNEVAWPARIGDRLELPAASAWRSVVVNMIHPSCDEHGQSWLCYSGCLIRTTGF